MLDSIEKFNIDLNSWIPIDLKTPMPICNSVCYNLNEQYIYLFGGAELNADNGQACTNQNVYLL